MLEADVVISIIEQLLDSKISLRDIGIVSPYKKQCDVISEKLRQLGHHNAAIGTAEKFQGQERGIMIISTVRTDGHLGFVSDARVRTIIINHIF